MNNNTQLCDDPNTQHFMWGESSELKSENNSEGSGSDGPHVRNKVNLNDEKLVCLRSHMWIHYVCCRLPLIYILYLEIIRTPRCKKREKINIRRKLMLILCMVIPHLWLLRKHVSHTIGYFYNK